MKAKKKKKVLETSAQSDDLKIPKKMNLIEYLNSVGFKDRTKENLGITQIMFRIK